MVEGLKVGDGIGWEVWISLEEGDLVYNNGGSFINC